jgi:glycosyltransferase involved in cell wall biosynthesis
MTSGLVILETHPIQYHAPVWRAVQRDHGIPVTVIYESDFSVAGYRDAGFNTSFAWDTDLLSGYESLFVERVDHGNAPDSGPGPTVERRHDRLLAMLKRTKPNAVLLVGYSPRFYQQAIVAALRVRAPLLFRAETTDHLHHRGPKLAIRDSLLRTLYRRCSSLLYIGTRSREHYRRLRVPDDRLTFSPYCVDDSTFQPSEAERSSLRDETRKVLDIEPDQHVVLFSGKLIPRKQPDLLLQALTLLQTSGDAHLVAVFLGDGPLSSQLKERVSRSTLECRFVGFQNQGQLSPYFHCADVFVLPSAGETWGLVVNEALLHGLPAVVSEAVGCAPDLITPGVTGSIFETSNADSLAQSIREAATWSRDPRVRGACRRTVAAYSVEAAAAGIANAYFRVTQTSPHES